MHIKILKTKVKKNGKEGRLGAFKTTQPVYDTCISGMTAFRKFNP